MLKRLISGWNGAEGRFIQCVTRFCVLRSGGAAGGTGFWSSDQHVDLVVFVSAVFVKVGGVFVAVQLQNRNGLKMSNKMLILQKNDKTWNTWMRLSCQFNLKTRWFLSSVCENPVLTFSKEKRCWWWVSARHWLAGCCDAFFGAFWLVEVTMVTTTNQFSVQKDNRVNTLISTKEVCSCIIMS